MHDVEQPIVRALKCEPTPAPGSPVAGGPLLMSRIDAQRLNLPTYYTGEPCQHGHYSPRYVSGLACIACAKAYVRKHRERQRRTASG
jgi:hypothetical protein